MSILTYQYRIKDSQHRNHLTQMAWSVHRVWNYLNEVQMLSWRRQRKFFSSFELQRLTSGCGVPLGLHSQTVQAICDEYVLRRRAAGKIRLKWRSRKRSLGWIPFYNQAITLDGDILMFRKRSFRLWLSRALEGRIKRGSFTQDARGRWYVNLQCEVADRTEPLGHGALGIDLGLANQITCSDGVIYRRDNLTRTYHAQVALAQRAGKKRRVQALHAKIRHVRKDWTHKVTTAIVRRAKLLVLGDVSSAKLVKTPFAKSTYDAAWGITRAHLHYKAIRLGALCVPGRETFSSVTCSACGQRTGPSGLRALGVREWRCSACGVLHHRDVNAAYNILRAGRCTLAKGIPRL